jgi:hypothetical protein
MMRWLPTRRIAAAGLTAALLLSASGAGSVFAALPDVRIGSGATATCATQVSTSPENPANSAVPAQVPANEGADRTAAFYVWAKNCDTSTVSQFFLSVQTAGTVVAILKDDLSAVDPRCSTQTDPQCTFGQVKPQGEVHLVVIVKAPATASTLAVNFLWTTVGNGHGDNFPWYDSVVVTGDGNVAGAFLYAPKTPNKSFTISNLPVGQGGGGTSTSVTIAKQNIPVTVQDGPNVPDVCPAVFNCVAETSEIHVGDGTDKYGLFKVVITIDKSAYSGINGSLTVIHILDDGVTYNEITATCPRNGTPTSECASISNGRLVVVTVWLKQNGYIKYH